ASGHRGTRHSSRPWASARRPVPARLLLHGHRAPRRLHSFPTRRSSDLSWPRVGGDTRVRQIGHNTPIFVTEAVRGDDGEVTKIGDRKSTRLNSSHVKISYAVFCLKKKKKNKQHDKRRPRGEGGCLMSPG